jgi:hypothetical protein
MSQFHNIFCASDAAVSRLDIAEFARDGWYGDGKPTFSPDPIDDRTASWDELRMRLPGIARPVIFMHDLDPAVMAELANEAITERSVPPEIAQRLRATTRVIGIELWPETLDDDAWELLDQVQAYIATRLDGILVAGDGIYDNNLQRLMRTGNLGWPSPSTTVARHHRQHKERHFRVGANSRAESRKCYQRP